MKHYSAVERQEVLIHATKWMNLENILSERSQTQKLTCCVIPFNETSRIKIVETESRLAMAGLEKGHFGDCD